MDLQRSTSPPLLNVEKIFHRSTLASLIIEYDYIVGRLNLNNVIEILLQHSSNTLLTCGNQALEKKNEVTGYNQLTSYIQIILL